MKIQIRLLAMVLVVGGLSAARAATDYWDINGSAPGGANAGNGDGTWDTTTTNWNPLADGTGTPKAYAEGDDVVFAAGNDLSNDATVGGAFVSISGSRTPASVTFEEGWVDISAALGLAMGTNPITVKSGATLSIPNQTSITASNGQTLTFDGGTFRNYIVGAGSTTYAAATSVQWLVTSNGGTINTPNGGPTGGGKTGDGGPSATYSIMAFGNSTNALSTIGLAPAAVTGVMHKTGSGEFRPFNSTNITGWDVQAGLLRAPSGSNDGAFGAVTGTVTVAGGAVANTTQGAAVGTTANLTSDTGGAGPSPATRSWVLTGAGATPDTIFVTNANWQILGNISGPGALMLNGWSRTDGGPATGTSAIGTQNELRLGGTNTYGGATTINFGTLVTQNGSAIPDTSRVNFSTLSVWGGPDAGHQITFNTAVLRVDASETVGSLSGGNATRGQVTINGAAINLTTGADNTTSTFSGTIAGTGSLIKSGSGSFTMDGVKSYTGDTKVLGGTLSTNSLSLADAANVYLATGATFNLNFSGQDTIKSLFFDNAGQAAGTWGAPGSGATNTSSLFSGTGLLNVSTGVGPVGVAGDYNGNGVVDMADYVLWRAGGTLQNDPTPGVQPADYDFWRAHFGNTSGSGSGLGSSAVPEPTTLVLLVLCLSGIAAGRRDR